MKMIAKGAEAEIYLEGKKIIKKRIPKSYRIKLLDESLRKSRNRREKKILEKLSGKINAPQFIKIDDKHYEIEMEYIEGKKVRDMLENNIGLCSEIGEKIAIMHNLGIIHGDLTTSNMIYDGKLHFIDFGLSFFSDKIEDKAVDLHLLHQALESKHFAVLGKALQLVLAGYKKKSQNGAEIIKRYHVVESRGRNKAKI